MREHPRKPKRHPLRELLAHHRDLEAVSKVNMEDLPRLAQHHDVRRVAVAEPEDVPHHAVHGERARVGRAPLEPVLRVQTLQPEHAVEVLARRVLERVLEHLDLLQQDQVLVVRCHLRPNLVSGLPDLARNAQHTWSISLYSMFSSTFLDSL